MTNAACLSLSAPASASGFDEARIVSKPAWRIMPPMMVYSLFASADRSNLSFAKKSMLQTDLSLIDTACGFGAGLFLYDHLRFEGASNWAMASRRLKWN